MKSLAELIPAFAHRKQKPTGTGDTGPEAEAPRTDAPQAREEPQEAETLVVRVDYEDDHPDAAAPEQNRKELLSARLVEYLDSQKWKYAVVRNDQESTIVSFGIRLKSRLSSCQVFAVASATEIQAFAVCPIKGGEEVRPAVAEYITRANYGLKIGKFEMDYKDGEVRYQSALPAAEGVPSLRDVERVVDIPYLMMDRFGDGLVRCLMGVGGPADQNTDTQS